MKVGYRISAGWVLVMGVVCAVALRLPFEMNILGMMIFGMMHIWCELRYLIGRTISVIAPGGGWLIFLALSGMAVLRLLGLEWPTSGRQLEIIGSSVLVSIALWIAIKGVWRWVLLGVVAVVGIVGVIQLGWYWHIAAHLHNFMPLIFLWDWSKQLATGPRRIFIGIQGLWALLIPAIILAGLLDPIMTTQPGTLVSSLANTDVAVAAAAFPGTDATIAIRCYVAFCFLQGMHYATWMGFFQIMAPEQITAVDHGLPFFAGWRFWGWVAASSVVVWAVHAWSYPIGRTVYSALGAFNTYYEGAAAVLVLAGMAGLPGRVPSAIRSAGVSAPS